jgi:hypothetical protein
MNQTMKTMLAFTANPAEFYATGQCGINLSNEMTGLSAPEDVIVSPQEFRSVRQHQFSGNWVRSWGINSKFKFNLERNPFLNLTLAAK